MYCVGMQRSEKEKNLKSDCIIVCTTSASPPAVVDDRVHKVVVAPALQEIILSEALIHCDLLFHNCDLLFHPQMKSSSVVNSA